MFNEQIENDILNSTIETLTTTIYKTKDGEQFYTFKEAKHHQLMINFMAWYKLNPIAGYELSNDVGFLMDWLLQPVVIYYIKNIGHFYD